MKFMVEWDISCDDIDDAVEGFLEMGAPMPEGLRRLAGGEDLGEDLLAPAKPTVPVGTKSEPGPGAAMPPPSETFTKQLVQKGAHKQIRKLLRSENQMVVKFAAGTLKNIADVFKLNKDDAQKSAEDEEREEREVREQLERKTRSDLVRRWDRGVVVVACICRMY